MADRKFVERRDGPHRTNKVTGESGYRLDSGYKVVLFDQTEISATGHHEVLAIVPVNERAAAPRSFGRWDEGAKLLDFDFVDQDDSVPLQDVRRRRRVPPRQRAARRGTVIERRTFLTMVPVALLAAPLAAEAQEAAKIARIGWLTGNLAANPHTREAFLQGLRDLGYVEGRNLVIENRDAEGKVERLPALSAELVALKVDVIVAPGTLAALAAKHATRTLSIVFPVAIDPVQSGLVPSLARPGGNVTGLSFVGPELVGKCLEQLKQAVPGVSRVAVLWQPGGIGERTEEDMLKEAETATRALGVRLQLVEARGPADIDRAFSDITRGRAGALAVLGSVMFLNERRRLVDLAAKNRLPAVYAQREFVDAGGLMAYGPNVADLFRRAATYVDKILKGAKPGDLPVEQPTKFDLVVNLRTAKALGLTIPPSLLLRADEAIQ